MSINCSGLKRKFLKFILVQVFLHKQKMLAYSFALDIILYIIVKMCLTIHIPAYAQHKHKSFCLFQIESIWWWTGSMFEWQFIPLLPSVLNHLSTTNTLFIANGTNWHQFMLCRKYLLTVFIWFSNRTPRIHWFVQCWP